MPKHHPIQIQVADPCHQNWDDMTDARQGRFCNACQKTVIDFTTYSDAALYRFFAANPQNVCGRFLNIQLNVPINIPHQPHSRLYRMTVALGLTLLFTQTPALLAQNRPPIAAQQPKTGTVPTGDARGSVLKGTVLDEKREPLISATVQAYQNERLMGGATTDYDGNYTIKPLDSGYYDILITYPGYDSLHLNSVLVAPGVDSTYKSAMITKLIFSREIVTMGGPMTRLVEPSTAIFMQSELYGQVRDIHGNELKDVTVRIYQGENMIGERKTDEYGEYRAIWLAYGTYELHVLYLDHDEIIIRNVKVKGDRTLRNITIKDKGKPHFAGGKNF